MIDIQRYKKRPVEVEAAFLSPEATQEEVKELASWCDGTWSRTVLIGNPTVREYKIQIHTLEGVMTASPGDYIIKGVAGEFYPCKAEIFHATYEEASHE